MQKLITKLKRMLITWLFKEYLSEHNQQIARELTKRDNRISELENHARMVKAVTNIGVDLHNPDYGRSWVAVAIRGKKEQWVQFFDGDDETIRQLQKMFSGLQKDKVVIDGRPGLRAKDFWF